MVPCRYAARDAYYSLAVADALRRQLTYQDQSADNANTDLGTEAVNFEYLCNPLSLLQSQPSRSGDSTASSSASGSSPDESAPEAFVHAPLLPRSYELGWLRDTLQDAERHSVTSHVQRRSSSRASGNLAASADTRETIAPLPSQRRQRRASKTSSSRRHPSQSSHAQHQKVKRSVGSTSIHKGSPTKASVAAQ